MSNFNINDISYICEHITNQDQFSLDSESEYYNQELAELVEDIITTISYSMISEGCSASSVLDFLSNAPEQDIVEYYFNCTLSEGVVSEEYIQEQFEILSEGIPFGLIGKAASAGLKNAGRIANIAVKRMAGPGVRKAVGSAIGKVKDLAKGAKEALPAVAKGAAALGLGAAGGYMGAKMAGAGQGSGGAKNAPSAADKAKYNASAAAGGQAAFKAGGGAAKMKQNPGMSAADVQKQGMINLRNKKPAATPPAKPAPAPAGSSNSGGGGTKTAPTPAKDKTWTFNNKQVTDAQVNKKYDELRKSDPKAAEDFGRNVWSQKYGQPTQGPKDAEIDKSSVEADLKAQQERDKKRAQQQQQTVSSSYEYDAYDLVLEYLFETGQAETINEAHYIMMELDENAIGNIVEAKYGTAAGRKKLAKKIRKGEDVGKPGGGFEAIVDKASPKVGKKRATKIAAAAMWKNLAKEED